MTILVIDDNTEQAKTLALALNAKQFEGQRMALNFELPADGSAPQWIELLPAGQVITGRDGRTWINDRPEQILAAFAAEDKDLPIDWEHSSQIKAPKGEEAPASGWIKEMEIRDGSLWARVEWTARGAASIAAREYRYLSPVFVYEIETNRIVRMTSCGLTNQPNLYLNALNKRDQNTEEQPMNLAELLAKLGLPATATFLDAINRIGQLQADHATALNQAQNPPLDKFVPRGDYDTALNRATVAETSLKAIKDEQQDTAINAEIDAALKAGKITPATVDYHKAQCRQEGGLDRFKTFVQASPVIAADSGLDDKEVEGGKSALNAEEKKICAALNISEEEYKKANP